MIYPITSKGMIPGGMIFQDPRVPSKTWTEQSFLAERVTEVLKFRLANPQVYDPAKDFNFLDAAHVSQEITRYNFNRLNGSKDWFMVTDGELPDVLKTQEKELATKFCDKCGGQVVPKFCVTCNPPKINSYLCPSCGAIWAKWRFE